MSDWLRNSIVYEVNTWTWLSEWSSRTRRRCTLGDLLPAAAWDELADLGPGAVWLMGVWERSPAGLALSLSSKGSLASWRQELPDLEQDDVVGSPYCIRRYVVDPHLGGPGGLATARVALANRGIRLLLDFVPNHIAPDHPWVSAHPEWLIPGSRRELRQRPEAFLQVAEGVFARGRDPYFPPWSDVLQLNVFSLEQRRNAVVELQRIAGQCDGVRCDMAMLVTSQVFARTWGERAGAVPAKEYWPEVIMAVKATHPEFRLIAEGYWDLELSLLEQGFDGCYDKGLHDQLVHGSAESIRQHLLRFSRVQDRLVRFLENHDEPRAARIFPWPKGAAAAVALFTLPGIRLFHQGQLEGRKARTHVHLGRQPGEPVDEIVRRHYARLITVAGARVFHSGEWAACETTGWPDNLSHRHLLAWSWRLEKERWLVVINYSEAKAQGRVQLSWKELAGMSCRLIDVLTGSAYDRAGDELIGPGLFVDLDGWACHLLRLDE